MNALYSYCDSHSLFLFFIFLNVIQPKAIDTHPYQMARKESNGVSHPKEEEKTEETEREKDEDEETATPQPSCRLAHTLQETAL